VLLAGKFRCGGVSCEPSALRAKLKFTTDLLHIREERQCFGPSARHLPLNVDGANKRNFTNRNRENCATNRWNIAQVVRQTGNMSKTDKKVTPRPKPRPFRSAKYLKHIRSLPCCNCGYPVSEAHHVETGGMGTKCGDDLTVPLCGPSGRGCHQKADKSKTSVKRYKPLARKLFREWGAKQQAKEEAKNEKVSVMVNCLLPGADEVAAGKAVEDVGNQKHPGGRPPIYEMPEQMQEAIDDYYESCWDIVEIKRGEGESQTIETVRRQMRPYTIMGLALAIGMTRETLCEYAKKGEFSDIVKRAKAIVERDVEENLLAGKNAAGPIFWLKNHAGYTDKVIQEQSGPNGGPQQHEVVTVHAESPEEFAAFRARFLKHGEQ